MNKRQQARIIKDSRILKRYKIYVIKIILFMTSLIAFLIGNFIATKQSTDTIYRRQDQLEFANQLSNAVAINYLTFSALFSFNNEAEVIKSEALVAYNKQAVEIRQIQGKIMNAFIEKDKSYHPDIRNILISGNECSGLSFAAGYYCVFLENKGQQTGLIALMALFEKLIMKKTDDYKECNKTTRKSVIQCSGVDQDIYLPAFALISGQAQLIADIIDHNLTESISEAEVTRFLFLAFFSASLLCVSLLIWFHILSKLREVDNNFKKVLLAFPSNLILSSFLLKMFLKKSSKGYLNF